MACERSCESQLTIGQVTSNERTEQAQGLSVKGQ